MFKWRLGTKIAVSVLLLLSLFVTATGLVAERTLHPRLKAVMVAHQETLAHRIAEDLDQRVQLMQRVLFAAASTVKPADLASGEAAQRFLDGEQDTLSVFDRSIFLFSPAGKLIAESPFRPNRRGQDFSFRTYITETLKTKKPFISEPFVTTKDDHHAVLMFASPVLDGRGDVMAIMTGSVGLTKPDVLGKLAAIKIGQTGYAYLTTADGVMIMHPDRTRMMKSVAKPSKNRLYREALSGWEGTDETVNSRGVPMLTSFRRIPSTGWILGLNYPIAEAYAPIESTFSRWFVAVVVAGGVLLAGVWFVVYRLSRPLTRFTAKLRHFAISGQLPKEISPRGETKEIAELGAAFNRLLEMLHEKETALREAADQYRLLADNSTDTISRHDRSGVFTYVSPSSTALADFTPAQMIEHSLYEFVHPDHVSFVQNALNEAFAVSSGATVTYMMRTRGRGFIWVESALRSFGEADGSVGFVSVTRNVSARKEMEDHLRHLASHDHLTQLPNRTMLVERLNQAIRAASTHGGTSAILLLDLDRFKNINDTLGHDAGDELLKATSRRIDNSVRSNDVTSRFGGDEFVILMPTVQNRNEPMELARRLVNVLAKPFRLSPQTVYVGASIGIALYPSDGEDASDLVKHADMAMYQVKRNGGNNYMYYHAELEEGVGAQVELEAALHRALEAGELDLWYQPVVRSDGAIEGAEALIRWRHPEQGLLPPSEFLPVAESSGLIVSIGEWVLDRALREAKSWREHGLNLRVAVNVSPRQFAQADVLDVILRYLNQHEVAGELLDIEIVESVLLSDPKRTSVILDALRERGVKISIDDFGIGYSNFAYLRNLPVNTIKIDKQFMTDMSTTKNGIAIVSSMVELGNRLGLKVVAEGVETSEQFHLLRSLGCDYLQGYYFAKPMPADAFLRLATNTKVLPDQSHPKLRLIGAA